MVRPTRKKDTRFVLRYKDGKIVLPEGQTLERRAVQHVDVCGGENVFYDRSTEEGVDGLCGHAGATTEALFVFYHR